MIVGPIRLSRFPCAGFRIDLPVVVPGIRIERAVADSPDAGAVKLIGSRSRQELNLRVAAAKFRIHRRHDDARLTDQIRAQICCR